MGRKIINVAGLNVGWFASVLGAAHGWSWIGPAVVAGLLALHLALNGPRRAELLVAAAAVGVGFAVDTSLIAGGVYQPARWLLAAPLTTLWLLAMWVNFALTLNVALRGLQGRWGVVAVLGLIFGPNAYYAGERLGALAFRDPMLPHLAAVGVAYAVAVPLLMAAAKRLREHFSAGAAADTAHTA
jgi:hypothetical protein